MVKAWISAWQSHVAVPLTSEDMMTARKRAPDTFSPAHHLLVEMEEVERPLSARGTWPIEAEVKAIARTVETGKALRLKFRSNEELRKIQMALRHMLSKRGLLMRYRKDAGDRIIAWAEKVKQTKGENA